MPQGVALGKRNYEQIKIMLKTIIKSSILWLCAALLLGSLSTRAADNAPIFDVPRLDNITVDGNAADWGERGFRLDVLTPASGQLPAVTDFDAKARIGWNERGLLVLLQVNDKDSSEAGDENKLGERDSVELFMAPQRGAGDHYQIAISPGLDAAHPQLRWHWHDQRQTAELKKINVPISAARTRTANGYTLEALLPWENLAIKPTPGREVAFQLGVNDWTEQDTLLQAIWYPATGAANDSNKMQRVRLADAPSPPVRAVVTGSYEHFRRTRLDVTAVPELAGQWVEVRDGLKALGTGQLTVQTEPAGTGRATAQVKLPMPPQGAAYGPLTLSITGRSLATLSLPDPNAARREAFNRAAFVFQPFVFSSVAFPNGDFQDPSLVEDLIGPYSLQTAFYDADYNVVEAARQPGRYGAIVTIKAADGQQYKRFRTLFRQPAETNWRRVDLPLTVEFPHELGVDPVVTKEQTKSVSELFKNLWMSGASHEPDTAVLLAGLYETQRGTSAVQRNDVWHRDARWWYELKKKTGDQKLYRYLLDLPTNYNDDTTKRWPLMLFLHGSGERGGDLQKVRAHGPPKLAAAGQQLPFIIVSPQCPDGESWLPVELNDVLNEVMAQYRVDPSRIYLTGLSMGGGGTWNMAMEYPDRFAAAAPIAAWGDVSDVARIQHLPVWAFHGTDDPAVPFEKGKAIVDALKAVGGDVKFTVYPGVGHDSWTASYNNPALYEWFLQHRSAPAQP